MYENRPGAEATDVVATYQSDPRGARTRYDVCVPGARVTTWMVRVKGRLGKGCVFDDEWLRRRLAEGG